MNFILVIVVSFIFSCENKSSQEITDSIKIELNKLDIKNKVLVYEKEGDTLIIDINFLAPYRIVSSEQQDVLISYIVFKQKSELKLFKNVLFYCYLDKEKTFNKRKVHYNKSKIDGLSKFYSENKPFVESLEYIMANFFKEDVFSFESNAKIIYKNFPNRTTDTTFFSFLKELYLEVKTDKPNKATNTMLLMYFSFKENLAKSSGEYRVNAERFVNYLSVIWNIYTNKNIDNMESLLNKIMKE